ncbi:hypothetical protein SDC9_186877 [bioreactor metagenome]|uniref:Uncharacterized protein n=1 Tax=bioreactor metagenome TaxID=1076179 RepID=A0A645HM75_9ZZZZ
MAFDGDRKIRIRQHCRHSLQGADRRRLQVGLTKSEEDAVVDFYGDAAAGLEQPYLALRHQWLQGTHDFPRDIAHRLPLRHPGRLDLRRRDPVRLGHRFRRHHRRPLNHHHRLSAGRTGGVLEGVDQRIGQHPVLAFVDRRNGVHDDEEGEQQGDEIGVGNQPALVVLRLFLAMSPPRHQCR